jgi:ribosomal protein S18 acetylase RimI-like enzyme
MRIGDVSARQATDDDFDFLWWLHRATMSEYVDQTWGWDDELQEKRFRRRFGPHRIQIVCYQGEPIGCISVEREPFRIFLGVIKIAPAYQRRGIGSYLVQGLCDEADAAGVPLELQVLKVNPARRLYERLGLVTVGETETHYLMRRTAYTENPFFDAIHP